MGMATIRFHVAGIGNILGFESEEERDAYEKYVDRKWTDRGYDSDSCLFWLY